MGANDSKRILSGAPAPDVITTIQRRSAVPQLDPCLERLQQLRVAEPLLKPPSVESSLTDILLQRNTSQSRSFEYGLVELAILPLKFYTAAHLLLNFIQLLSQSQLVDTVILQQRSEQKFRV
jgi:hypothetical protein